MAEVVRHRHGKARVRVGRVWREGARHAFVEWSVSVLLSSHCEPAFTAGDNSAIVATDSIKNTVYAKAKECTSIMSMEEFAIILGEHFVKTYPQKGVPFSWGSIEVIAFQTLKEKLTTGPVLTLSDLQKSFEVYCDACGRSLGAVLMQEGHVIAYESRVLKAGDDSLDL
ncbi:hypothetical protein L7F22_015519 [Adiantum nelumboides]|nr:hypothetical protein [Adiantum nelumboides]